MRWSEAVVLVTGASRGIGRDVAIGAARRGARIGLLARSAPELEETLAAVRAAGGDGAIATADVTDPRATEEAVAAVRSALGPVDVLVANAGIGAYGAFADGGSADGERLMRVNYAGVVNSVAAALPEMRSRRSGHLVFVGSVAGRVAAPQESVYSASKFAVSGLAEALAVELARDGIGVTLVNPGPVATDFFDTRGHPYDRPFPRPVSSARVADALLHAVERNRFEVFVPRWLRIAPVVRALAPNTYARAVRRFS